MSTDASSNATKNEIAKSDQASSSTSDGSKKRPGKRWWRIVGISTLAILLMLLAAPRIVTATMRGRAERQLSQETGFDVQLGSLSAGWFSSIVVGDIVVKTPSGDTFLELEKLHTEKSLLGLMFRDKRVGTISFDALNAHVPLEGEMLEEIKQALEQIDVRDGLLGRIVNPDNDAILRLAFGDARVHLRPRTQDEWQPTFPQLSVDLDIDHTPQRDILDVAIQESAISLSPELCDFALKYIAPVLAGSLDLNGTCSLAVPHCHLELQDWRNMEADGVLNIEEANADVQAKLVLGIANAISDTEEGSSEGAGNEPLILQLAKQNAIEFRVHDGKVHHEGLSFGLPSIFPNLLLRSQGDVGFDQSLDFELKLAIPFEHMGDEPLLQELGSPSLTIPVQGTFEEPKVAVGKGNMMKGFVSDVVKSLTDEQVDPAPFLELVGKSGMLQKRKKRRDGALVKGDDDLRSEANSMADNNASLRDSTGRQREGLRNRIRNRREERSGNSPQSNEDVGIEGSENSDPNVGSPAATAPAKKRRDSFQRKRGK